MSETKELRIRCRTTGAKVQRETYVCSVVDRYVPVRRNKNGEMVLFSSFRMRDVLLTEATCQDCPQLNVVGMQRKGG